MGYFGDAKKYHSRHFYIIGSEKFGSITVQRSSVASFVETHPLVHEPVDGTDTRVCWYLPAFPCYLTVRECIQKFPDWIITKETAATTKNTRWEATQRIMAAKLTRLTHKISDTSGSSGRELYHLQLLLQAASPETFGYTLVCCPQYPLDRRLGGSQSPPGHWRREKSVSVMGIEPRSSSPWPSHCTDWAIPDPQHPKRHTYKHL
jgi:hypothetical protein